MHGRNDRVAAAGLFFRRDSASLRSNRGGDGELSEKLKGWALLRAAMRNRKTAAMLVLGFASGLPFDYIENRAERLDKLTIDDINDAADAVFTQSDLPVTGVMLPQSKSGKGDKQ